MSEVMKAPRDLLVAGIGFLLGMVFCYFVLLAKTDQRAHGFEWAVIYGSGAVGTDDLHKLKLNWN